MFSFLIKECENFASLANIKGEIVEVNTVWKDFFGILNLPFHFKNIIEESSCDDFNILWTELVCKENFSAKIVLCVRNKEEEHCNVHWTFRKYKDIILITGKQEKVDLQKEYHILKNSMAQLSAFLENTSDAVYWGNQDGDFEYVNKKACEMLGYSKGEFLKLSIFDIDCNLKPKDTGFDLSEYYFGKKNRSYVFETYHRKKNGELIPVEVNAIFIWLGNKGYTFNFVRDITKRKHDEEVLIRSQCLLKEAQRIAKISSFEISFSDSKVVWSDELYELTGYKKNELDLNLDCFSKVITPKGEEFIKDIIEKALKNKSFPKYEHKLIRKNGEIVYVKVWGAVEKDSKGEVFKIHGVIQDVTERKFFEENILKQQKLLLDSHRIAKMGVWELDLRTNDVVWNNEFYNILDMDPLGEGEASIDVFKKVIHPDDLYKFDQNLHRTIETKKCEDLELRLLLAHNKLKYVIIAGDIFLDEDDVPVKLHGIIQDVTTQKKQELQLIEAKEKAEQGDRLKSAFLANMSHEIRTPMNAIIGFSAFLKDPENTHNDIRRYADIISSSGEHLLALINDIIDISKIDAGQVDVTMHDVNINHIVEEVFDFFQSFIIAKNKSDLKLLLESPHRNIVVYTDEMRLRQILFNLIGNAIKFTDKGKVKIIFKKEGEFVQFAIEDTGIGIPLKKQDVIFQRFQQGAPTTEKFYGGTGLGLSIAKACVGLLGGDISFASKVGGGTTFYFSIKG